MHKITGFHHIHLLYLNLLQAPQFKYFTKASFPLLHAQNNGVSPYLFFYFYQLHVQLNILLWFHFHFYMIKLMGLYHYDFPCLYEYGLHVQLNIFTKASFLI